MKKNINLIVGIVVIVLILVLAVKAIVFDCIIGIKIYNENNIVMKYHRFINIVSIKNNSSDVIEFHYQSGHYRGRGSGTTVYKNDITDYKRSDSYEINPKEKLTKYTKISYDGYVFTVTNDNGLHDSVKYNKSSTYNDKLWF